MKVLILVALLGVAAAAVHRVSNVELDEDWLAYKTKFGKNSRSFFRTSLDFFFHR